MIDFFAFAEFKYYVFFNNPTNTKNKIFLRKVNNTANKNFKQKHFYQSNSEQLSGSNDIHAKILGNMSPLLFLRAP